MATVLTDRDDAERECNAQITAAWERWVHGDISYEQLEVTLRQLKAEASSGRAMEHRKRSFVGHPVGA
jgi:hypothetical protein